MAQSEPYRMLKDWSYEKSADPVDDEENNATNPGDQPEFTDVCSF